MSCGVLFMSFEYLPASTTSSNKEIIRIHAPKLNLHAGASMFEFNSCFHNNLDIRDAIVNISGSLSRLALPLLCVASQSHRFLKPGRVSKSL